MKLPRLAHTGSVLVSQLSEGVVAAGHDALQGLSGPGCTPAQRLLASKGKRHILCNFPVGIEC